MKQLNRNTTNNPIKYPERVLQFGGGNFLRAFCDWMINELNEKTDFDAGVIVVKPTEGGNYKELKQQDGLFHVALDGIKEGEMLSEVKLISCVSRIIHSYNEWDEYLKTALQPEIRYIISNTTEAGIKFSESDDFEATPPKEFPAKLTLWLHARFDHFKGAEDKGCILLPCELIENNGEELLKTVLQYIKLWNLGDDFQQWIENHNYFCSTLVDRIVSGFPENRKDEIQRKTGYEDPLLVAGEEYHSWIIKAPETVKNELPFDKTNLNVEFVEDLASYRELKVRILNGAHTSLVPVGYLAGLRTVKESMDDKLVSTHVEKVLREEIKPTLSDFQEAEIDAFINSVLDRFRNPTLKHYLLAISLNSTSKFQARLLPAFKEYASENKQFPKRIAFSMSCMLRFYKGEFSGKKIEVKDDSEVIRFFTELWERRDSEEISLNSLVETALSNPKIFGEDLTKYDGLVETIAVHMECIEKNGVHECLKSL
ncbi:tagaturonate reductase [Salegentibacter agarivorans]|uniref:Tagaturonate reductase n=1 Tax=Salegentibacter agarivorans TaxID=345907 RepID=A0A1I2KLG6_9FLAO|nr:tagaturonate reductase [Salegentibacter agarivorans]SFF67824.1 tagaturonate reductase [Salegentibacter agarivorans]